MDTCVALANSYLRCNGYVATHEQPVLVGEELELHADAVDVIVGEVKQSHPRLNEALREPDTQPPSRRPSRVRKPPKLPEQPSFDRPEDATTLPAEKKRVRKRKAREKQPPKGELQPRIHRAGQHLKTA